MAELLWDCRYEESDGETESVAVSQNPYVHMETMEETKDKGKESEKDGSTGGFGMAGGKQPPWVLVYNAYSCYQHGYDKRKTDKQWLL